MGLRDTTELQASSPEMWRDICLANRGNLLQMIDRYIGYLQKFQEILNKKMMPKLYQCGKSQKVIRERLQ